MLWKRPIFHKVHVGVLKFSHEPPFARPMMNVRHVASDRTEVLVVDDDDELRAAMRRILESSDFSVEVAAGGGDALDVLDAGRQFDCIVTDLQMPGIHGVEFLRRIRHRDLDVPVIVVTGNPSLQSAISVIEYGGFRYLRKPFDTRVFVDTVREAAAMHRLAVLKRRALELCESGALLGDRAGLDAHFDAALENLWIAFQPILFWPEQIVYGHEALARSTNPTLSTPQLLFDAALRLGRLRELGRRIRATVAQSLRSAPPEGLVFVNVHAADLADDELLDDRAPLSAHARRVVLEVTERASLDAVSDVRGRIAVLRKLGFRIAVDNLGAGYAGLASFSQLAPDIAKLDMSLVRDIDSSPDKSQIVRSMIAVCKNELNTRVICEGVETPAERDALKALGAELLQGYLFGRPGATFSA
jgi:EAL domain-containing protein (putative c-di-GMP-specific phosphodiesterase class I)